MKVVMSMIETKLSLFDVEVEEPARESSVFGQSGFGITPERFNSVDMVGSSSKLIFTVMDSEVSLVTDIDKSVIPFPAISMNDTFISDFALDNGFQSLSRTIFEHIGEDFPASFEHPNDRNLSACSTASFASNPTSTEVTLVNLNNTFERSCSITFISNPDSDSQQVTIDCGAMNTHNLSNLSGFQIERKEPIELSKLITRKSGTFEVTVSH
jgi:hypothetical protein